MNLKYGTNELLYKTETDSQTQRTDLWLPRGRGREGWTGRLGLADANVLYVGGINKALRHSTGNYRLMMISAYIGRRSQHAAEDMIHMWATIKAIKEQQGNEIQG